MATIRVVFFRTISRAATAAGSGGGPHPVGRQVAPNSALARATDAIKASANRFRKFGIGAVLWGGGVRNFIAGNAANSAGRGE